MSVNQEAQGCPPLYIIDRLVPELILINFFIKYAAMDTQLLCGLCHISPGQPERGTDLGFFSLLHGFPQGQECISPGR